MLRSAYTILFSIWCVLASSQSLKLFTSEIKAAAPKSQAVVMDFLERYFSKLPQQTGTTVSVKMADDKVFFRNGKLSNIYQIADSMPFTISLENRYYQVEWKNDNMPFVTIVFPAQYDLLLGMGQEKAQNDLKNMILSAQHVTTIPKPATGMTKLTDNIYEAKTAYMELESLNDATYYNKVGSTFQPYFNVARPDYSASNLFHGLIEKNNYRMYIEQSIYGLKTINYIISMQQWLDYCAEWGMKVYFAIEEEREDGLLALVIAECKELGFNHMLSVVIPNKFVTDKNTVMKVRMTSYIPTHNIKDLFHQESVNHRKIQWQ